MSLDFARDERRNKVIHLQSQFALCQRDVDHSRYGGNMVNAPCDPRGVCLSDALSLTRRRQPPGHF